jgi:excisionase family DNA binding protein
MGTPVTSKTSTLMVKGTKLLSRLIQTIRPFLSLRHCGRWFVEIGHSSTFLPENLAVGERVVLDLIERIVSFQQGVMTQIGFHVPAAVAQALSVSETTIKRWVEAGVLAAHQTAGGHHKVLLTGVSRMVPDGNESNIVERLAALEIR